MCRNILWFGVRFRLYSELSDGFPCSVRTKPKKTPPQLYIGESVSFLETIALIVGTKSARRVTACKLSCLSGCSGLKAPRSQDKTATSAHARVAVALLGLTQCPAPWSADGYHDHDAGRKRRQQDQFTPPPAFLPYDRSPRSCTRSCCPSPASRRRTCHTSPSTASATP